MNISDIDTPAIVIDLDVVEANLTRAQSYADAHGFALRPHIKTHRLPKFARWQVELGAQGINCQKLGEAEVMADAGLTDILVTFNIIGAAKLDRLAALHARIDIAVVADNVPVIEGYAARFTEADRPLDVMVECDTGAGRNGAQSGEQARDLARRIKAAPGLRFAGLLTYPPADPKAPGAWLASAKHLIEADGIAVPRVSPSHEEIYGFPTFSKGQRLPGQDHATNWFDPTTGTLVMMDEPSGDVDQMAKHRKDWADQNGFVVRCLNWGGTYRPEQGSVCDLVSRVGQGVFIDQIIARLEQAEPRFREELAPWTLRQEAS